MSNRAIEILELLEMTSRKKTNDLFDFEGIETYSIKKNVEKVEIPQEQIEILSKALNVHL